MVIAYAIIASAVAFAIFSGVVAVLLLMTVKYGYEREMGRLQGREYTSGRALIRKAVNIFSWSKVAEEFGAARRRIIFAGLLVFTIGIVSNVMFGALISMLIFGLLLVASWLVLRFSLTA